MKSPFEILIFKYFHSPAASQRLAQDGPIPSLLVLPGCALPAPAGIGLKGSSKPPSKVNFPIKHKISSRTILERDKENDI